MSQPPSHRSSLGAVVVLLYGAAAVGVISAVVSATEIDVPNSLKFVFAALSAVLGALCFAVGVFIDIQRS